MKLNQKVRHTFGVTQSRPFLDTLLLWRKIWEWEIKTKKLSMSRDKEICKQEGWRKEWRRKDRGEDEK